MEDKEILQLWKNGLTKNKVAEIYKREFNQDIKIIRAEMHNRHEGRFITNYEALRKVEETILEYIKTKEESDG